MKIYQAGPLFSKAEREWHKHFKAKLETSGYDSLWPGDLFAADEKVTARQIMEADRDALLSCDAVVALLDGPQVDDGTAWEIGYAYAKGLPIIGIRTDFRICSDSGDGKVNAMIQGSVIALCQSEGEVLDVLKTLQHNMIKKNHADITIKTEPQADAINTFKRTKNAAEGGDAKAQFNLAVMYAKGEGIQQDYSKAREWYEKAAEQGHSKAQFYLSVLCYQDSINDGGGYIKEAIEWGEKAAEQGDPEAQYNVGFMHCTGYGGDDTKGIAWCEKAANQGHVEAQYNLGYIYQKGYYGIPDETKADEWFAKAAEQGHPGAQFVLGLKEFQSGYYETAYKWFASAAEAEFVSAKIFLGFMYFEGLGVELNSAIAYNLWESSVKEGDYNLPADCYLQGNDYVFVHDLPFVRTLRHDCYSGMTYDE